MILQLSNVDAYYGDVNALKKITLGIEENGIVALLGRNGSGKTTTMKSIMGLINIRSGDVIFNGENITNLEPHKICKRGISWIPDERRIWSELSVFENLDIAKGKYGKKESWNCEQIFAQFPILEKKRKQRGGTLSGGEKQMLAIGRALMCNPDLLLMDEASEGLAPVIVKLIFNIIREIESQGIAILLVEQNVKLAMEVAHCYHVMEQGRIVHEDTNEDPERSLAKVERLIAV